MEEPGVLEALEVPSSPLTMVYRNVRTLNVSLVNTNYLRAAGG